MPQKLQSNKKYHGHIMYNPMLPTKGLLGFLMILPLLFGCTLYKSEDRDYVESNAATWLQSGTPILPVVSSASDLCGPNFNEEAFLKANIRVTHAQYVPSGAHAGTCQFFAAHRAMKDRVIGSCFVSAKGLGALPLNSNESPAPRPGVSLKGEQPVRDGSINRLLATAFETETSSLFYQCQLYSLANNDKLLENRVSRLHWRANQLAIGLAIGHD